MKVYVPRLWEVHWASGFPGKNWELRVPELPPDLLVSKCHFQEPSGCCLGKGVKKVVCSMAEGLPSWAHAVVFC